MAEGVGGLELVAREDLVAMATNEPCWERGGRDRGHACCARSLEKMMKCVCVEHDHRSRRRERGREVVETMMMRRKRRRRGTRSRMKMKKQEEEEGPAQQQLQT